MGVGEGYANDAREESLKLNVFDVGPDRSADVD
jgi:hypothetical protein